MKIIFHFENKRQKELELKKVEIEKNDLKNSFQNFWEYLVVSGVIIGTILAE